MLATWVAGCRTPLLEALPECLESSIAFAAGCETPLDELLVLWVVNLGGIDQTLFASGAFLNEWLAPFSHLTKIDIEISSYNPWHAGTRLLNASVSSHVAHLFHAILCIVPNLIGM